MNQLLKYIFPLIVLAPIIVYSFNATMTINTENDRKAISPYIYGTNQTLTGTENWSMRRTGGNRWTGYNWENNASNAGADWNHSSDTYLGGGTTPGKSVTDRHDENLAAGRISLFTIPMAGYVSKDKNGTVSVAETAPSSRWDTIVFVKPGPFVTNPDITDDFVYMDEFVNFLVGKYGKASTTTGINAYLLDNEPALWPSTHPRIHKNQPTCVELTNLSRALAVAIKNVDETADIYGPVFYGFAAMTNFQSATDWSSVSANKDYKWFVDYYLHKMKLYSDTASKRLLDALDIHWYSEAKGDNRITSTNATTDKDKRARVQAPRTLWNEGYIEDSWIGKYGQAFLPLLPAIKSSIDKYNPDTKLTITEWNYGGENDISGGIAVADALGIYGKFEVYAASYWKMWSSTEYTSAGFKLFRNFDELNGTYGSINVQANTDNWEKGSIYASQKSDTNTELHTIIMNKSFTDSMDATISITSNVVYVDGVVWGFDSQSSIIKKYNSISSIKNNKFAYKVPPLSVYHMVLSEQGNSIKSTNIMPLGKYEYFVIKQDKNGDIQYFINVQKTQNTTINLCDIHGRYIYTLYKGVLQTGQTIKTCSQKFVSGVYVATVKIDGNMYNKRVSVY